MTELAPYQVRVVKEKADLDERLAKLSDFLPTPACFELPFEDRCLLVRQEKTMKQLSAILGERIERFTSKERDPSRCHRREAHTPVAGALNTLT